MSGTQRVLPGSMQLAMDLVNIRRRIVGTADRQIAVDTDIADLLAAAAVVAIGVSGGKDSCALAIAVCAHLDAIGHKGPRVLIHADLGRVEWKDSLPTCERLAAKLGIELMVVRREQGDMMDRWLQRWRDNVARYASLECVKLILPWSTPSMRFCTSELKTSVICKALVKRFPGQRIVSAAGIRRDESKQRSEAEISEVEPELDRKKARTTGRVWNPLVEWTEDDVRALCAARSFALHEGYTRFGMSRISCAFCIMADLADLMSSAACNDNVAIYREMVDLEIVSTFAFQGGRWLGDVAPHLLTDAQREGLASAKTIAAVREAIEEAIPEHLLFERGWPKVMPTREEAELLCDVRRRLATVVGLEVDFVDADQLLARYAALMAENALREAAKAAKAARKVAREAKAKKVTRVTRKAPRTLKAVAS